MLNFYKTEEVKQFLLRILIDKEEMAAALEQAEDSRAYWSDRCLKVEAKLAQIEGRDAVAAAKEGTE